MNRFSDLKETFTVVISDYWNPLGFLWNISYIWKVYVERDILEKGVLSWIDLTLHDMKAFMCRISSDVSGLLEITFLISCIFYHSAYVRKVFLIHIDFKRYHMLFMTFHVKVLNIWSVIGARLFIFSIHFVKSF